MSTHARLTARQRKLIAHPPQPGTWECRSEECRKVNGGTFNAAKRGLCWLCGKARTRRRKVTPWDEYLDACKLAGVEPIAPKESQWTL